MSKSFRDWLCEGETIYAAVLSEFKSLESQIEQLEAQLTAKKDEVNQIAQVIGKPPVETSRRLSAELVDCEEIPAGGVGSMARVLSGRSAVTRA